MYAAPIGNQIPPTATAIPHTKIRQARVQARFLRRTRSADFHAATIAPTVTSADPMFSRDHGQGALMTTNRLCPVWRWHGEYPIGSYGVRCAAFNACHFECQRAQIARDADAARHA